MQRAELKNSPAGRRSLRIFASDPMQPAGTCTPGACITIEIPYEKLGKAPLGARFEVIDYDGAQNCFYPPVNLDDPETLERNGLEPSVADPRFHQQMVYAIAMRTLENFENAVGRRIRFYKSIKKDRLRLIPHAFCGENAFFAPRLQAVLFGYFPITGDPSAGNQTFFTCLSHDIIVHELTHAFIHRMRGRFIRNTNPDVLAFHEGFADIVALFQHFSYHDFLEEEIRRDPDLSRRHLVGLAQQFGYAKGKKQALRSAIDAVDQLGNPRRISRYMRDPYERGSILVAAVFDAFFNLYEECTRDLPADRVHALAKAASDTAQAVLYTCIRAFDYMPPVDITFYDYLRALVTADYELNNETFGELTKWMVEAFQERGICPKGDTAERLLWEKEPKELKDRPIKKEQMDDARRIFEKEQALRLNSPTKRLRDRSGPPVINEADDATDNHLAIALSSYAKKHWKALKLAQPGDESRRIHVEGFHISERKKNGKMQSELVIQLVQTEPSEEGRVFQGGVTLVTGTDGHIRYIIPKPLPVCEGSAEARRRREEQRAYMDFLNLEDPAMDYSADEDDQDRSLERMGFASFLEGGGR